MKGVQCYELFGGIALKITHFYNMYMCVCVYVSIYVYIYIIQTKHKYKA